MGIKTTVSLAVFLAGAVFLACSGDEVKFPDVGSCTYIQFFCSMRMCSTSFLKGLQQNNKCSDEFLSLRSCMMTISKSCLGVYLNNKQLALLKASFKKEYFCGNVPIPVPTPPPGSVGLPCGSKDYKTRTDNCQKQFDQKYSVNKADPALCSTYASSKKCLRNVIKSECNYTGVAQVLKLHYGIYNPFCTNNRDPGATGSDQCDGVDVIVPTLTSGTGLTADSKFGASAVLFGIAVVDHFMPW